MSSTLKILALTMAAMAAFSAVMAAGASAQLAGVGLTTFNTTTNTHDSANLTGTPVVLSQYRVTGEGTPKTCLEEKYSGTTTGTEQTFKLKPTYGNCHLILFGSTVNTTATTNGCEYQFHVDKEVTASEYEGHASIQGCTNADKSITTTTSTGCTMHIPQDKNQNINGVKYVNSGTGVKIVIKATNLHTTVTNGVLACGHAAGTYTNGTWSAEINVTAKNTAGMAIDATFMKLATQI